MRFSLRIDRLVTAVNLISSVIVLYNTSGYALFMNLHQVVTVAREAAGLSKRELARRAETFPAAIVEIESGRRSPTVDTVTYLVEACGFSLEVALTASPSVSDQEVSRKLVQVIELAESLPRRKPALVCGYPRFPR